MKLVELYTSIQGEGPNTGKPIQFVRFGGCNYRCPGWPCDTPFAIYPEKYQHEWESVTPEELLTRTASWPHHLCLTGGEPLLQPRRELEQYFNGLPRNYKIDIFTNGSRSIPSWGFDSRVTIVMDWKLPGSGETPDEGMRLGNAMALSAKDAVKFVVKDDEDLMQALHWSDIFYKKGVRAQQYVGAVWGAIPDTRLVEFITEYKLPWRLNVQMHNHIWDPQERAR